MTQIPHDILLLQKSHIFVVGDLFLDSYISGQVVRISPEAPVPILNQTHTKHVPGGAANAAANVAKFGAKVTLCGRIGQDAEGKVLQELLREIGVQELQLLKSASLPTIQKTRVMTTNQLTVNTQQVVRVDREIIAPLTQEEEEEVCRFFLSFCQQSGQKSLLISDYSKGFFSNSLLQNLIQLSQKHHIPAVCDPKSVDVSRYSGVTLIKPNLSEGRVLFRAHVPQAGPFQNFEEEISEVALCYLNKSGAHNIVMSLSEHGLYARGQDFSTALHFETQALEVADVSGAGDTLVAFLAMGVAVALPLPENLQLANIAAGIVCSKLGTATVQLAEIMERVQGHASDVSSLPGQKLVSLIDLEKISSSLSGQGKRLVFTNGCFDLLHAGHVDYLQKAAQLGDMLIIGLNSDQSVKKIKGEARPIQCEEDRAQILSALSCVAFVVLFNEETPLTLIQKVKPHILVKGADYDISTTVGAEDVLSWGGKVEHIPLIAGRSTSAIIQRIQNVIH